MFSNLYHTFVFDPLYNGLIGLMDVLPWIDAGVAVILFTCIIKFILFPLSKKAIISQIRMKKLEPEMASIRAQYKGNQQVLGVKLMELYKIHKVNPFSMLLPLIIQLPIIFALYSIFAHSGLPHINSEILYSFISVPEVKVHFLGILDITKKSIILSLITALSQYVYLDYTARQQKSNKKNSEKSDTKKNAIGTPGFAEDFGRSMTNQMKYFLPVIIFFVTYSISAAIGIYWTVSNLFTLAQDYYIRKKHQADESEEEIRRAKQALKM